MLMKDIDKLQFGTYIRFRDQLYLIVGMKNYYFYMYPCKGINDIRLDYLKAPHLNYSDIAGYEIVAQTDEDKRDILYTKLLFMAKDKFDKDKIGPFEPLVMTDITKHDIKLTIGLDDKILYHEIELYSALQRLYYDNNVQIIIHLDKINSVEEDTLGIYYNAQVTIYTAKDGYYIEKKHYDDFVVYQYMIGTPYKIKGKMTKEFVIEDYEDEFNAYLENILYEQDRPRIFYTSPLEGVITSFCDNFSNNVLSDKMYLLYKETGERVKTKPRLKWQEMRKLRQVIKMIRVDFAQNR